MKYKFGLATVFLLTLCSGWVSAEVKNVMLVINYGDGTAINHSFAAPSFVAMMTAMSTEHQFTLTTTQPTDPAAQKQAALADMKNQDVVLFANIGVGAFTNVADQAIIKSFFANGGKAIGCKLSRSGSVKIPISSPCGFGYFFNVLILSYTERPLP
jgi:hypothetical protein